MSTAFLTLALPDALYQRLERAAAATKQSLEDVALHALRLGSPPAWDDVPPEFQVDLASLEKLDDRGALEDRQGPHERRPRSTRRSPRKGGRATVTGRPDSELEHLRHEGVSSCFARPTPRRSSSGAATPCRLPDRRTQPANRAAPLGPVKW